MSIAFRQALIGGVILALIEGVSTIVTSVSMRNYHMIMQEEQKKQVEAYKRMLKRGGGQIDPWAVDFNENQAKQGPDQSETLIDKAKSFSF